MQQQATNDGARCKNEPRVNVARLVRVFFLVLVLPTVLGVGVDLVLGLLPIVTIVAIVLVFPIAAVVISRTALAELDFVIQEVAPVVEPQAEDVVSREVLAEEIADKRRLDSGTAGGASDEA